MRAVQVTEHGGADTLSVVDVDRPTPAAGQALVRVTTAGVNYMDIYQRNGGTPVTAPFFAGVEGVGVVESAADDGPFRAGQRVGWLSGGQGSWAEYAVVAQDKLVALPEGINDAAAAAVLMQGVTAHYLATDTYPIQQGDTVLVHAAAGGVGRLLTQIAKLRGARVVGTVSSEKKAAVARAAGADHIAGYDDFPQVVKSVTDGVGAAAVYDGVGKSTFDGDFDSLRPRGVLVIFGTASGPTPPLEIPRLNTAGSLYVTRPTVVNYTATPDELRRRTDEVFGWVADGKLDVAIGGEYPLERAADAQRDLESRASTGKLLIRI